jgi:hypothetical protein
VKLSGDTRYPELLAVNGMVVGPGMIPVQAGIDELQNGGTAADCSVAGLVVGGLMNGWRSATISLNVLVHAGGRSSPIEINIPSVPLASLLHGAHALLNRAGSRSLYDLALSALRYSSGDGGSTFSCASLNLGLDGEADLAVLLRKPEDVGMVKDVQLWRQPPQSEAEGLTWIGGDVQSGKSIHLAAVDHRGMAVSMILSAGEHNTDPSQSTFERMHCMAIREGQVCLVCGVTGRGPAGTLSNFLTNLLNKVMGVQQAVEVSYTSTTGERNAVGAIAIDRNRGVLIGGQDPGRGSYVAGY